MKSLLKLETKPPASRLGQRGSNWSEEMIGGRGGRQWGNRDGPSRGRGGGGDVGRSNAGKWGNTKGRSDGRGGGGDRQFVDRREGRGRASRFEPMGDWVGEGDGWSGGGGGDSGWCGGGGEQGDTQSGRGGRGPGKSDQIERSDGKGGQDGSGRNVGRGRNQGNRNNQGRDDSRTQSGYNANHSRQEKRPLNEPRDDRTRQPTNPGASRNNGRQPSRGGVPDGMPPGNGEMWEGGSDVPAGDNRRVRPSERPAF